MIDGASRLSVISGQENKHEMNLLDFVNKYMPRKEEWISIKERIVTSYERVKLGIHLDS